MGREARQQTFPASALTNILYIRGWKNYYERTSFSSCEQDSVSEHAVN
jgi:hypothetical protein